MCRKTQQIQLPKLTTNDQRTFYSAEHGNNVLQNMLKYSELCDVTLITPNGKRILAHQAVLAAASEYFAKMFTGSLREWTDREVALKDTDLVEMGDSVEVLINYIYSGRIELNEGNAQSVLCTASLLRLVAVIDACCEFFTHQLDPSNCLGVESIAKQFGLETFLDRSQKYTLRHFNRVYKNEEFLCLSEDRLANLLASNDLNVYSEEEVVRALETWLHHEKDAREKSLPKLLGLVRFPFLELKFISKHVRQINASLECNELIMKAYEWHLFPQNRTEMAFQRTQPRNPVFINECVLFICETNGVFCIEQCLTKINTRNQPPKFRKCSNVVVMDEKLFILGGYETNFVATSLVNYLDFNTLTWRSLKPMNSIRAAAGVSALNGLLYAVGGWNDDFLQTAERYDPTSNCWTNIPPMSIGRYNSGVIALNDRLYVIGGSGTSGMLNSVECFNPNTNSWKLRAEMNEKRRALSVAVMNGFIYAVGGLNSNFDSIATVERYNPTTNEWARVASLSIARHSFDTAVFHGNLVAFGGFDSHLKKINIPERYDAEKNKWIKLAALNSSFVGAKKRSQSIYVSSILKNI